MLKQRALFCIMLCTLFWGLSFSVSVYAASVELTLAALVPPPLPGGGCGHLGTPIDYNDVVCCVSGYIFVDGQPVSGANVTVTSASGAQATVQTKLHPETGIATRPYFTLSLNSTNFPTKTVDVKPGEVVTLTATYNGQVKSIQFVASSGGQQIDIVMPKANAAWQAAYLGARYDYAMAYDAAHQQVVLFGGISSHQAPFADTWVWDGARWSEHPLAIVPPPRYGHSMVYDVAHQQIVLFGGQSQNREYLQDTWVWNGVSWEQLTPLNSPAGAYAALAYDANRQRVVLFGGDNPLGSLGDTWEWDGVNWTEMKPNVAPASRLAHAMTYRSLNHRVYLYGGQATEAQTSQRFADFWAWDGTNWTQLLPQTSPPGLAGHALAYDAARQEIVLFGGVTNPNGASSAIWTWNGADWVMRTPLPAPSGRSRHSMTYDELHQQLMLFGGLPDANSVSSAFADTWLWDGNQWHATPPTPAFLGWQDVGWAYEQGGNFLSFGGLRGNPLFGAAQSATFRWSQTAWSLLNPTTIPPARYGHRLNGNQNGDQLLMFGGLAEQNVYLADTWLWTQGDWHLINSPSHPSARAYYSLAYDNGRKVWVLFGGIGATGELNDLWEFNGTIWQLRQSSQLPAARQGASLTYDPVHQQAVLFGGRTANTFLDDLWAWDGMRWQKLAPLSTPPARAGHGAIYDTDHQVLVIAGGGDAEQRFQDTWAWNGATWQSYSPAPALPPTYALTMAYDRANHQAVAHGEMVGGNLAGEGIWLYKALTTSVDPPPIATIQTVNQRDGRQGLDTFQWMGRGAASAPHDQIQAYQWKYNDKLLSANANLSLAASTLPLGAQTISFAVQDAAGIWSTPITETVFVRSQTTAATFSGQPTWTLLLYVLADNNLAPYLGDNPNTNSLLSRLRTAGNQTHVQVGVLYDGDGADDTRRYTLTEDGAWHEERLPEADMGKMETVRDFIHWGVTHLPSDYVGLSLLGQANGVVGFGTDNHPGANSTASATILSPRALRTALQAATDEAQHKLDVLHFDGASFGLLEDAALVDGVANFVIASPNLTSGAYPYEQYRRLAATAITPRDYALAVARNYSETATRQGWPYTISVFDLAYFAPVSQAVGQLGDALVAYIAGSPDRVNEVAQWRTNVQTYISSVNQQTQSNRTFVDLFDLANVLKTQSPDINVQNAAAQVATQAHQFLIGENHASGLWVEQGQPVLINLARAGGLGLYYPSSASSVQLSHYLANRLFPITPAWGWSKFLSKLPPPPTGTPLAKDDELLNPLLTSTLTSTSKQIYLPVIAR